MARVDLNSDLGESFGAFTIGDDAAMLDIVTSANVACGFHGGDPLVMARTLKLASANKVRVGAHPSFYDLWGFGRRRMDEAPEDVERLLIYQIGALQAMARAAGMQLSHFKAHGSLANMAAVDADLAGACVRAVQATDESLVFFAFPGSELERVAGEAGLTVAREVFADRAYDDDGQLVPRKQEGAVIHDPAIVIPRILAMVREQSVTVLSGKRIAMAFDTICVHSDTPSAVALARNIRDALTEAGVAITPVAEILGVGARDKAAGGRAS